MAKGPNQKLKLLYLKDILLKRTDESHGLTMQEIITALAAQDIQAERKSIYADFEALRVYGIEVISKQKNKTTYYHIEKREFELAELKLLVDIVQSSKFITPTKSNELIHKLEGLASKYEGSQLQRQVYVTERIKTGNESIYSNVDMIHAGISQNVKIQFQYFQWNVNKKMELKHNGEFYCISPWALTWDAENYYMFGYDKEAGIIKYYRVDKMINIQLTDEKREGEECFSQQDMAVYTKKRFGMFDGEEQKVKIECKNNLVGVIIDRFGKDVSLIPKDREHFTVNVDVAVSDQFLGWIIALGKDAKIIGPENVVNRVNKEIQRLIEQYAYNQNSSKNNKI